jgi:hypothetical protein
MIAPHAPPRKPRIDGPRGRWPPPSVARALDKIKGACKVLTGDLARMRLRTVSSKSFWRRIVGWVAVYSLVFHTVVVGLLGPLTGPIGSGNLSAASIICHGANGSGTQDPATPKAPYCQFHCPFCSGSAALLISPASISSAACSIDANFGTVSRYERPAEPLYLREQPRGPPQEA